MMLMSVCILICLAGLSIDQYKYLKGAEKEIRKLISKTISNVSSVLIFLRHHDLLEQKNLALGTTSMLLHLRSF